MFCCCYDDFCNREYFAPPSPRPTHANPTAEWTVVAYILLIIPFLIIALFFITCCLGFCPYISRSREELEAGVTELEFLHPPRQEGDSAGDEEEEYEQIAATSCTLSPPDEATAASPASYSSQRTTGDFSPLRTESSTSAKSPTAVKDISPTDPEPGEARGDSGIVLGLKVLEQ